MKVLELFAGTRSIGIEFEKRGHEVFSVDWDKDFKNIDLYTDINDLTAEKVFDLFGKPDIVWASPDCTTYSVAAISRHRRREKTGDLTPISDYAKFCDATNIHVLQLIRELAPKCFFIENPRGGLRKMEFMQGIPRYTVTYCQYNDPYVQEVIFKMNKKKCPKCGQTKDIGEFYKCKSRRDGFTSWCKECSNTSHKNYVENNREQLREYDREEYYKNRERHLENRRKSNERNKEKIKKARKVYYKNNKERILEQDAKYRSEHKDAIAARMKKYYEIHKDEFVYRARERKKLVRATKDGTITKATLDEMYEAQEHKCGYCGRDLDELGKHLDHILPLSKGGRHTINNVHWVCPKCNLEKNNKTEEEWLKKERQKPTDIFTNHPCPEFKPPCKPGAPCHVAAPRGSRTGTQALKNAKEKARIPEKLCQHIVRICEKYF